MYDSDNLAIAWELRDSLGNVSNAGISGGKRSWLLHKKYSKDNILLRTKQASGLGRSAKTTPHDGPGDVCRKLEDGSTLHAFLRPDIDPDLVADMNALEKLLDSLHNDKARDVVRALLTELETSLIAADEEFLK